MNTDKLTPKEETILIFALRYTFGRQTYAPSLVCEHIKDNWDRITESVKTSIVRDILSAIRHRDGANCDLETYSQFLESVGEAREAPPFKLDTHWGASRGCGDPDDEQY